MYLPTLTFSRLIVIKYILFFIPVIAAISVKAQSGYNYQELGIGGGASYIRGYTNVKKQYSHPAFNFNFIYNYNPYVPIEAEIQSGTLSGGGLLPSQDRYGREYVNNYKAIILHGDYQFGAGLDYSNSRFLQFIKDFYLGTGVGLVDNNNKVQRTNLYPIDGPLTYVFPGSDKSIDIDLPLRFGYELKIYDAYNIPSLAIDLGYIHSIVFNSGLDGYNDSRSIFKHNSQDQYRQFTIMVKYYFGTVTSYTKLIREFR
jgi:hypothetical protein